MFITLDGVVSDPHLWHPTFMSAESMAMLREQLDAADGLLLGRQTYEDFFPTGLIRTTPPRAAPWTPGRCAAT